MLRQLECPGGGTSSGAFCELGVGDLAGLRKRAQAGNVVWIDAEDATDEELAAQLYELGAAGKALSWRKRQPEPAQRPRPLTPSIASSTVRIRTSLPCR